MLPKQPFSDLRWIPGFSGTFLGTQVLEDLSAFTAVFVSIVTIDSIQYCPFLKMSQVCAFEDKRIDQDSAFLTKLNLTFGYVGFISLPSVCLQD